MSANFFELQKFAATGIASEGITEFDKMRALGKAKTAWQIIRDNVRKGLAPTLYPLGTILYDNGDAETGTAYQVVAYDNHFDPALTARGYTHSMTLCEYAITDSQRFDAPEAWLYVETEIPAGAYRFTLPDWESTYGGNRTYIATLTQAVPAGGNITITWPYNANPSDIRTYASNYDDDFIERATISVWNGTTPCTDLGTLKLSLSDPDSAYGKLNSVQRARFGSNNYEQSNLRQYINGVGANWWVPQTIFDRLGITGDGKMTTLNTDFVAILAKPAIKSRSSNAFECPSIDGTDFALDTDYTVTGNKMFLIAPIEINVNMYTTIGTLLDYYSNAGNAQRIKYQSGTVKSWWLRAPNNDQSLPYSQKRVYTTGSVLNDITSDAGIGVITACVIQ